MTCDPKTKVQSLVAAGELRKAELIERAGGLYTISEVALILKTSEQTIEERHKAGEIIAVRQGRTMGTQPASSGRMEWYRVSPMP
jgi:hypothetical protein